MLTSNQLERLQKYILSEDTFNNNENNTINLNQSNFDQKILEISNNNLQLKETEAYFIYHELIYKSAGFITVKEIVWQKKNLSNWLSNQLKTNKPLIAPSKYYKYNIPTIINKTSSSFDVWDIPNSPIARTRHTAIWTGSEMLIWGKPEGGNATIDRYNPAIDSWVASSDIGAPNAKYYYSSIWTGTEMIIWGGSQSSDYEYTNSGTRYNPGTDSWAQLSISNAPSPRISHSAIWTGEYMIIWGGQDANGKTNTGSKYNPKTNSWVVVNTVNSPSSRYGHTATWTGNEMIVWGGDNSTGGKYNPNLDSWTTISTINSPSFFIQGHTSIWTGEEMIIWGGADNGVINTGSRYNPNTDSWIEITNINSPIARTNHTAIWTEEEMIIWGGRVSGNNSTNTGSIYNPSSNEWTNINTNNAPVKRTEHTAIWTGTEMIVWGGSHYSALTKKGGRYNPLNDSWTPVNNTEEPINTSFHSAVWTGSEMIIWGGIHGNGNSNYSQTGAKYYPSTDNWLAITDLNSPIVNSAGHVAIWTGINVIIWEGTVGNSYNPINGLWSQIAPNPSNGHYPVWTGEEMIVWGDLNDNSGARYNPDTDIWIETNLSNAPDARGAHAAIWNGAEMIVWGGRSSSGYQESGGKYNPLIDTWSSISSQNSPNATSQASVVWTGEEMIVWGGYRGFAQNIGGKYNYDLDEWTELSPLNLPEGASSHTALWTGKEMLIWGGYTEDYITGIGTSYLPCNDTWSNISTINAPSKFLIGHSSVWTGNKMIIWGGADFESGFGLYTPTNLECDDLIFKDSFNN